MIRKLPRWVWFGGGVLALMAGTINAVGYLSFDHQAVTHMTGTTTLVGIALAGHAWHQLLHFGAVLVAFFLGASFSGLLIRDSALELGHRYGLALLIEALLLFVAVPLIHQHHDLGLWLAAAACGLQNAMVSTYSGAVVRTTHVSGIVTDLGILFGQRLRGKSVDRRRSVLYLVLFGGFLLGGIAGALAFPFWRERTLLAPAAIAVLVAAGYMAYLARRRRA
ncbi:YoaK family protein [Oleiagrimonas sp. C23AA]|uniref:YoaK family protein n=1 Tax=Oleiagrimonas sp. C23AA TaxID=2719047 RepID=UPI001421B5DA|nr:YoaK family protein [Oleiagrimonas sp. C23AA]NII10550.1 DUF1275 domain-containing protein [Oleiagrimonas sp. C23AA]